MVKLTESDAQRAETSRRPRPIRHAKRYEGFLDEPIVRNLGFAAVTGAVPSSQETADERFRRLLGSDDVVRALRLLKLDKLLEHYGLPHSPRDLPSLALCLAIDFVPGMAHVADRPRGPGRARERKGFSLYKAVEDVLRRNPKMTVSAACEHLTRKSGQWKGSNADSLRARYYETKREIAAILSTSS